MLYFDMLHTDADVLLRETAEYTRQERLVTTRLLVRLAAVETRELYAPAGYSSMWDYCLGELHMSDDAAGRRLWAARKCREFPALFDALADDRIHLTAVHTLAAFLRPENVDELIKAATGRSKPQLKDWLACRFPRPAEPTEIRPIGASTASAPTILLELPSVAAPELPTAEKVANSHALARVPVPSTAMESAESPVPLHHRARVDPLNAEQVKLSFTMPRRVLAKMQHAMALLGSAVAPDDVAALFERLLDMSTPALEKQKFAATDEPRAPRVRKPRNARSVPAHVRREVWTRDGGQCTFESASGRRCTCRRGLQFDHVKPVAHGGEATIENIRLLCPKHNQLEAERRLGKPLMDRKRLEARQRSLTGHAHKGSERTVRSRESVRRSPVPMTQPERHPPLKAPHEDELRAELTSWGHTRSEISIGLSAALRLPPEAGYEARLEAALETLRPRAAHEPGSAA